MDKYKTTADLFERFNIALKPESEFKRIWMSPIPSSCMRLRTYGYTMLQQAGAKFYSIPAPKMNNRVIIELSTKIDSPYYVDVSDKWCVQLFSERIAFAAILYGDIAKYLQTVDTVAK